MTASFTRPVARVRTLEGVVKGTGFLALGRYVVTCAHVVDEALARKRGTVACPEGEVRVDLPFLGKEDLRARVVAWFPTRAPAELARDPLADIAVLELAGGVELAGGFRPGDVDRRPRREGSGFKTFGFPEGFDNGVVASGETLILDPGGWLHVRDMQDFGYFIVPGFSGAPAVSSDELRLIGMATAADRDAARRLAFLLPSHLLCRAWPPLAQPYRGLFSFTEEDADLFFGRDGFIDELRAKLDRASVTAVVGPSGSGKSSVVLAGLAPLLRAEGWSVVVCRPGRDPVYELTWELAPELGVGAEGFEARNRRAEDWAARLREDPGRILELAARLRAARGPGAGPTLLAIDQFEELFTADGTSPEGAQAMPEAVTEEHGSARQRAFLRVLEALGGQDPSRDLPIRAVATLRADFMAQALGIGALARLLRDADVKLGPMRAEELTQAIREPARVFGVAFEQGLVEAIVAEMTGRPGGLPLLQFALERLWGRQSDRMLTVAAYAGPDGRGGLRTALEEKAESVLAALGPGAEAGVRRVMLRLVRLGGEEAPDARAVATRAEIGAADWPLVQRLAEERLVMIATTASGVETAEVAHEALIGGWSRLRDWLTAYRLFGLWRQRLGANLGQWSGAPQEAFLRGGLLAEATGWLASHVDQLNTREAAFIEASRDNAAREAEEDLRQAQERERLARELAEAALERERLAKAAAARQRSFSRWLGAFVLLLIAALGVGGYFYLEAQKQTLQAEAAATRAETSATQAKGRQLAAEAVGINQNIDGSSAAERAAALAIEGWRRLQTSAAFDAAVVAWKELPVARVEHGGAVLSVAFSSDGTLLATASNDNSARLIRTLDGAEVARIEHGGMVYTLAFSPDGTLLSTGSLDDTARLIRVLDGAEIARFKHGGMVWSVAFNPDGTLLATGSNDGSARLIRVADGAEVARFKHGGTVWSVAFSPDGMLLATGSADGRARLVRVADGMEIARVEHGGAVIAVAFSPDGMLLATGSWDGSARLIRVSDGVEIARIEHGGMVNAVAFSPDGMLFVTGSDGNGARLVRITDGVEIARIEQNGTVISIAFSLDGTLLAIGNADGSARLIRVADSMEIARIDQGDVVWSVAFSPDGMLLATGSSDDSARLIRTLDGTEIARVEQDGAVNTVVFSPDGTLLATSSENGSARIMRIVNGAEIARVEHGSLVIAAAFNPNVTLLAIGSADGNVRLVHVADSTEITRVEQGSLVWSVAFSPDGALLAIGGADGSARLVRVADGTEIARVAHEGSVITVAFSPDGTLLATGSRAGTARLVRVADGVEIALIEQGSAVTTVGFSPDGALFVTGSEDNSALLVRVADGAELTRVEHGGPVITVAFSPDGTLLATGSADGSARLVRVVDGVEIARIEHGGSVTTVAFSPDGMLLATGGDDNSARLVRVADGVEIARIEQGGPVNDVTFSPDGTLWATASDDGSARLWQMPDVLFDRLCKERIGRNLTAQEWQRHIGDREAWAPTCAEWPSDADLFAEWRKRQNLVKE